MSNGETKATKSTDDDGAAAGLSGLAKALVGALPAQVSCWTLIEHPLFAVDEWFGIEVVTPGVVLSDAVQAEMRQIFADLIPLADWAMGYNQIRFSDRPSPTAGGRNVVSA